MKKLKNNKNPKGRQKSIDPVPQIDVYKIVVAMLEFYFKIVGGMHDAQNESAMIAANDPVETIQTMPEAITRSNLISNIKFGAIIPRAISATIDGLKMLALYHWLTKKIEPLATQYAGFENVYVKPDVEKLTEVNVVLDAVNTVLSFLAAHGHEKITSETFENLDALVRYLDDVLVELSYGPYLNLIAGKKTLAIAVAKNVMQYLEKPSYKLLYAFNAKLFRQIRDIDLFIEVDSFGKDKDEITIPTELLALDVA